MIRSFIDKDTASLYNGHRVRRFESFRVQAERRLQILDSATCLDDLARLPSNRLEALSGNRKGDHRAGIGKQVISQQMKHQTLPQKTSLHCKAIQP